MWRLYFFFSLQKHDNQSTGQRSVLDTDRLRKTATANAKEHLLCVHHTKQSPWSLSQAMAAWEMAQSQVQVLTGHRASRWPRELHVYVKIRWRLGKESKDFLILRGAKSCRFWSGFGISFKFKYAFTHTHTPPQWQQDHSDTLDSLPLAAFMQQRRRQTLSIAGSIHLDVLVAPAANEELSTDPLRRNSPHTSRSYSPCTGRLRDSWCVRLLAGVAMCVPHSPPACRMCCWSTPAGPAAA